MEKLNFSAHRTLPWKRWPAACLHARCIFTKRNFSPLYMSTHWLNARKAGKENGWKPSKMGEIWKGHNLLKALSFNRWRWSEDKGWWREYEHEENQRGGKKIIICRETMIHNLCTYMFPNIQLGMHTQTFLVSGKRETENHEDREKKSENDSGCWILDGISILMNYGGSCETSSSPWFQQ